MNLNEIHRKFSTDEECLAYIEQMRWPDGIVRCPTCGAAEVKKVERKKASKNKRGWFYLCQEKTCRAQFSPTAGTIFHDTHLPLLVWFQAVALMLNAKKGISAMQLQRDLGIGGYKTAWYLNHRIREAMEEGSLPQLGGIVEIDETYIGGRVKGRSKAMSNKDCVIGLRQRKGQLRLVQVEKPNRECIMPVIEAHVADSAKWIVTDESKVYQFKNTRYRDIPHLRVNHRLNEYVRGNVYTNTVESAFSLFKRGIAGQFHRVSLKHLQRYLNEAQYRFNRRDCDAFMETVRRLAGFKPLPFATLTAGETEAEAF